MIISRRSAIKAGMAAGAVLTMPSVLRAQTAPNGRGTVRMQMNQALTVYDPVITTTTPTQNHALAIYDTLFALDSNLLPKPQMVGKWGISTDKKSYTFELRDGLSWHDGTLVTAADCVASIRRWAEVDPGGQLLMRRAKDIATKGDKTFVITLREPLGILVDILATISSGLSLYIMREKDANRPATEQVTTNIGSGPFKFNEALAKPGASFTYERNENYVPRKEPADLLAGGKVANVDRVVLEYIADSQTALSALQAGEIDYGIPPADLYSVVEEDPNLTLEVLDKRGSHLVLRMNCLQKPFNNVKARQAVLHLIDQEAMMRIAIVDPKYYRTGKSIFGDYSPYTNDENTSWFKPGGNPEKAKQLFKEAGYAGEKIVVLQPTDWDAANNASQLVVNELQKIGINAELAPSDWGGLVARRSNKGPVEDGGWSIFITDWSDVTLGDPLGNLLLVANGEAGWFGWPKNDEYEALRAKWADVDTLVERQELARKMQRLYWDFVGMVLLGGFISPIARRKTLNGLIGVPDHTVLWNMRKEA